MTGYMDIMLALCVLNDYVSFYNVIFIIYLPLKVSRSAVIKNPRPRGCEDVHVEPKLIDPPRP